MAKAINWPLSFRQAVLNEDETALRIAVRLGDLYYENRFWVDGEVVDIRVDSKKTRKAVVHGDPKRCTIQELTPEDYAALKPGLDTQDALIAYLQQTYEQPVAPDTVVTVVAYKNLPVDEAEIEF